MSDKLPNMDSQSAQRVVVDEVVRQPPAHDRAAALLAGLRSLPPRTEVSDAIGVIEGEAIELRHGREYARANALTKARAKVAVTLADHAAEVARLEAEVEVLRRANNTLVRWKGHLTDHLLIARHEGKLPGGELPPDYDESEMWALDQYRQIVTATLEAKLAAAEGRVALAEALAVDLQADLDRSEGRWGIHGHSAVDDDYFAALAYCIAKLRTALDGRGGGDNG